MVDHGIYVIPIMVTVGVLLNLFVVVVLAFSWRKLNVINWMLFSFTLCDLIQATCGYSYMLIGVITKGVTNDMNTCYFQAAVVTWTSLTAISHLAGMSILQYHQLKLISSTLHDPFHSTKRYSLMFIIPCWLYGLFWAVLPFLGWSRYVKKKYWCSIDLQHRSVSVLTYNACLLIFCFLLPVIVIARNHYKFLLVMKDMQKKAKTYNGARSHMEKRIQIEARKKKVVIFIMILVFFICWTPYAFGVILQVAGNYASQQYLYISALLGKSSVCFNPIIYVITYKDFNKKIKFLYRTISK